MDLVSQAEAKAVENRLTEHIQPHTHIVPATHSSIDSSRLLETALFNPDETVAKFPHFLSTDHSSHDATIMSVGAATEGFVSPLKLRAWLNRLCRESDGRDVLRVKGMVHTHDSAGDACSVLVIQCVGSEVQLYHSGTSSITSHDHNNRVIVIGRGLDMLKVQADLQKCAE